MNKMLIILIALSAGYYFYNDQYLSALNSDTAVTDQQTASTDAAIASAFANHTNNLQIAGSGVVIKLLPQDNNGSRHQKFILRLSSGHTLLISHNIDLAPRIDALREGDTVQFFGEYEWSAKGGVIHWTHRDPKGSHIAGWLKHRGKIYQ